MSTTNEHTIIGSLIRELKNKPLNEFYCAFDDKREIQFKLGLSGGARIVKPENESAYFLVFIGKDGRDYYFSVQLGNHVFIELQHVHFRIRTLVAQLGYKLSTLNLNVLNRMTEKLNTFVYKCLDDLGVQLA